jgi:4-hydroxybenzoate polyprenyltransferase
VFKCRVFELALPNAATLPYRTEVVDWLQSLKQKGFKVILATASPMRMAQRVADELQLFDGVVATEPTGNLTGQRKLEAIHEYCKAHGFDQFAYLGDSAADLPIWRNSAVVFAVAPGLRLRRKLSKLERPQRILIERRSQAQSNLRALRPYQWSKNLLVFLPTLLAHDLSAAKLWLSFVAFCAFSLCSSAVYVLNDLLDLEADRRHPLKSRRPFAAGESSLLFGFAAAPLLMAAGIGICFLTGNSRLVALLSAYLAGGVLYSIWLKRMELVDVVMLSGFYFCRIEAGSVATGVPISEWMLVFSLFFFFSVALAKRFVELDTFELSSQRASGRGYGTGDVQALATMGSASGYLAVLVMALYVNSPQVAQLYASPRILYFLCPAMLYWISRLWLLAHRNQLHDDPIVFALTDRISLTLGVFVIALIILAWGF